MVIDGSPKEFGIKECSGGWGRIDRVKSLALRSSVFAAAVLRLWVTSYPPAPTLLPYIMIVQFRLFYGELRHQAL